MSDFSWPAPRKRLKAEQQDRVTAELRKKYDAGASIRALAEESGRSYGYVHRRLAESGVTFRSRGGNLRSSRRPRGSGLRPPR
ncbi:helix-turn-helix domain-containing protein [Streptoverticillium reticulum]|uniref:helix-turn-helix domain-containing protein n=1 Tax=Streptoverticillium reticulum TaxID=1433415 RepID=UPI0039BF63D4